MSYTKKNTGIKTGLILLCTLMMASSASAVMTYNMSGQVICGENSVGVEGIEVYATDCQGNLLGAESYVTTVLHYGETDQNGEYTISFDMPIMKSLQLFRLRLVLPDGSYRTTECMRLVSTNGWEQVLYSVEPILVDSPVSEDCSTFQACKPCKGKVTQLTMQYRGSETAYIAVDQSKVKSSIFEGFVQPGDTFTVNGQDKGTLGTEISVYVDVEDLDTTITKIHTSCSQPIGPGMAFGDFLVLEGYSKDGGLLCPQEPSDNCACEGKVTVLEFQILDPPHSIQVFQKSIPLTLDYKDNDPTRFTIKGIDKNGTMGTEIVIVVDGVAINLHTSCSRPIGIGMPVGDYLVITDGYSLTGGKLCEYNAQ